jgi:hypothetical protein
MVVCVLVCMRSNFNQTWYTNDYIYENIMYVCLCVCIFQNNSGTSGAISTKLSTHVTIYIYTRIYNEITSTVHYR